MIDNETENRVLESVKKSMGRDLSCGQKDLMVRVNKPDFVNRRSTGTFKVLTDAELAERRGDY